MCVNFFQSLQTCPHAYSTNTEIMLLCINPSVLGGSVPQRLIRHNQRELLFCHKANCTNLLSAWTLSFVLFTAHFCLSCIFTCVVCGRMAPYRIQFLGGSSNLEQMKSENVQFWGSYSYWENFFRFTSCPFLKNIRWVGRREGNETRQPMHGSRDIACLWKTGIGDTVCPDCVLLCCSGIWI